MYKSKKGLSDYFGYSPATVYRRVEGIKSQIGKRYNRYAICDDRICVEVFADYCKYHLLLEDPRQRDGLPRFSMTEAGEYMKGVEL